MARTTAQRGKSSAVAQGQPNLESIPLHGNKQRGRLRVQLSHEAKQLERSHAIQKMKASLLTNSSSRRGKSSAVAQGQPKEDGPHRRAPPKDRSGSSTVTKKGSTMKWDLSILAWTMTTIVHLLMKSLQMT